MKGMMAKLHWWIIGGMLVGALWGSLLHAEYFDAFHTQAVKKALPGVDDPKPAQIRDHAKTIRKAVISRFKETPMGGAAHGLAALFMKLLNV